MKGEKEKRKKFSSQQFVPSPQIPISINSYKLPLLPAIRVHFPLKIIKIILFCPGVLMIQARAKRRCVGYQTFIFYFLQIPSYKSKDGKIGPKKWKKKKRKKKKKERYKTLPSSSPQGITPPYPHPVHPHQKKLDNTTKDVYPLHPRPPSTSRQHHLRPQLSINSDFSQPEERIDNRMLGTLHSHKYLHPTRDTGHCFTSPRPYCQRLCRNLTSQFRWSIT